MCVNVVIIVTDLYSITIALTTCNGASFLRAQLDSIFSQTGVRTEVVVCDDASTDDTLTILREYASQYPLTYFSNPARLGVVKNFQRAMQLCHGDYVALADQDDVWLPDKLQLSLQALQQAEAEAAGMPVAVVTDLKVVDADLHELHASFWAAQGLFPFESTTVEHLVARNFVTGCTLLMNRRAVDLVLPFPDQVVMHDWWIGLKIKRFGRLVPVARQTILYRQHGRNEVGFVPGEARTGLALFGKRLRANLAWFAMIRQLGFPVNWARVLWYKLFFHIKAWRNRDKS